MNINEHVEKNDNFWDMGKVTAYVISTAIVQMYKLCCVCVQIEWFTVNRNASKSGDSYCSFHRCKL